jgi:hypothetical protein
LHNIYIYIYIYIYISHATLAGVREASREEESERRIRWMHVKEMSKWQRKNVIFLSESERRIRWMHVKERSKWWRKNVNFLSAKDKEECEDGSWHHTHTHTHIYIY